MGPQRERVEQKTNYSVTHPRLAENWRKGSTQQACSRSSGTLPTHLAPGQLHLLMQPLSQDIQCKDRVRCCGLAICREGAYAERGALPSNHHHFSLSLPQRRLWIYRPVSSSTAPKTVLVVTLSHDMACGTGPSRALVLCRPFCSLSSSFTVGTFEQRGHWPLGPIPALITHAPSPLGDSREPEFFSCLDTIGFLALAEVGAVFPGG